MITPGTPTIRGGRRADQAGLVLLVDDDPDLLEGMERGLRGGFKVLTALGPDAGLQVLRHEAIDVVVCDLLMPVMDGLEVLDQVHERRPEAIRILMTGQPSAESAIDAINHGEVFRYLTKPVSPDHLLAALHLAMASRHARLTGALAGSR